MTRGHIRRSESVFAEMNSPRVMCRNYTHCRRRLHQQMGFSVSLRI
jgi:hypothetical protein